MQGLKKTHMMTHCDTVVARSRNVVVYYTLKRLDKLASFDNCGRTCQAPIHLIDTAEMSCVMAYANAHRLTSRWFLCGMF